MTPPALDYSKFIRVAHVAVVDEFTLTNDDGRPVATIDEAFLQELCENMNEREHRTGDLCPLVLGRHTKVNQDDPDVVGFAKNWRVDKFFETGKLAAFADFLINREDVDRVKSHPRRSSEVWVSHREIDPSLSSVPPLPPAI